MKYIYLFVFFVLLVFSSCEKKLDIDLPDSEKHLVVNGIICPDSLFRIRISKSQNVLDNDPISYISDAIVELIVNGTDTVTMEPYHEGIYEVNIYPKVNDSYKLFVDNNELTPVTSNVTLLPPVPITSIDTSIQYNTYDYGDGNYYGEYEIHFDISVSDDPSMDDYYFLAVSTIQPIFEDNGFGQFYLSGFEEYYLDYDSNDPVFKSNSQFTINGITGQVVSDEIFNGTDYTFSINTNFFPFYNIEGLNYNEPIQVIVKLLTVNADIYRYIISFNLNQETQYDPFAQPVQIYSNIENGLGIFSGYTMYSDTLLFNF